MLRNPASEIYRRAKSGKGKTGANSLVGPTPGNVSVTPVSDTGYPDPYGAGSYTSQAQGPVTVTPTAKDTTPGVGALAVDPSINRTSPGPTSSPAPSPSTNGAPIIREVPSGTPAPAQPLVPSGTFADTTGQAARILELRNQALRGFSDPEITQRRESFLTGIEGTRSNAMNDLQRRQTAGGVKGGIAFAQNQAVNNAALGARAGAERDLSLADMQRRRDALNELEGTVGKERFGGLASSLAERQLAMQQAGQAQTGQFQQDYLKYLSQQGTGQLPGEDRTGPSTGNGLIPSGVTVNPFGTPLPNWTPGREYIPKIFGGEASYA